MQRLHVGILDEELPYPLTSGKRIRTFNLLRRLALRHRITYIAHRNADHAELVTATAALKQVGIEPIIIDRAVPPKAGVAFYGRLLRNLASSLPYSVTSHTSREMMAAVQQLQHSDPVDLWHCEWSPYAQTIRQSFAQSVPWMVMAHNVESTIWERYVLTEPNFLKRQYIRHQWRKFVVFEKWAYTHADRVVAVSAEDGNRMASQFGAVQASIVDNGVDVSYFQPPTVNRRNPFQILFLGSLDWRPNLDGVTQLLETIFPRVRAAEPRASLVVVGRNPPLSLQEQVAKCPGVELHANVADVRNYLHSSSLLAVPLRIGGGSRLKILEALATALPVVTTTIGVEGLQLNDGQHVSCVSDVDAMADAIIQGLRMPKAMQLQALRGRQAVLDRYDWGPLADRLDTVWRDMVKKPVQHAA